MSSSIAPQEISWYGSIQFKLCLVFAALFCAALFNGLVCNGKCSHISMIGYCRCIHIPLMKFDGRQNEANGWGYTGRQQQDCDEIDTVLSIKYFHVAAFFHFGFALSLSLTLNVKMRTSNSVIHFNYTYEVCFALF